MSQYKDTAIIVPSRGRPYMLADLVAAVHSTSESARVVACLDRDDPELPEYRRLLQGYDTPMVGKRRSLSAWTNYAARVLLQSPDPPRFLASMGDDHRPRTPRWDAILTDAIKARGGSGFAYGNDMFHGQALPTSWVASADVVDALGWMMLPVCEHLSVDNAVLALGLEADCIQYVPQVVIEHMHPMAGKGRWDASYRASNSRGQYTRDGGAFEAWRASEDGLSRDAATIRALMGKGTR